MPLIAKARGLLVTARSRRETAKSAGAIMPPLDWQLDAFNAQWRRVSCGVSWWAAVKSERGLPDQFDSWEQVCNSLPSLQREDLQERIQELCFSSPKPHAWRSTGGSTGQPVRVPIWRSEVHAAAADMWRARSWFGVSPSDKAFLIWGHSHLLGHGLAGWARGHVRAWKDNALGYRRWSAYRIGDADLHHAAERLLQFRPAYVLGYSVALDRFARVNEQAASQFRALGLKAVIATGESFPRPESRQMLQDLFSCPVVMEYGAVETGVIAHEASPGEYRVFWGRYFLELVPSAMLGHYELLLTSLYPRCLPLIRYRVGDFVVPASVPPSRPVLEFRSVLGRCNDTVVLPDGRLVHSEAIAHATREVPLSGFQLVQRSTHDMVLRYTSPVDLTAAQTSELRARLARVAPELTGLRLERVEQLRQTIAGKTRAIHQESCGGVERSER